jgi:hypothetical protein
VYLRQVGTSPLCPHLGALLEEEKRARISRVVIRFPPAFPARLLPTPCGLLDLAQQRRGGGLPAKTRVGRRGRGRGYKIKSSTAPASQQTITPPTTTSNHYPTPPRLFISPSPPSLYIFFEPPCPRSTFTFFTQPTQTHYTTLTKW